MINLQKAPVWSDIHVRYIIISDELKKTPVWLDMHQDTDCGEVYKISFKKILKIIEKSLENNGVTLSRSASLA